VPPGCTIGADLGGTKLLAVAVDSGGARGEPVRRRIAGLRLEELLDVTEEAVRAAVPPGEILGAVGFGIPSLIDRVTGVSASSNHLPLDGVPFGALMAERLHVPVTVDNDANCAVLAEWRVGAAAGCSEVVMLTLGTGIGGGLVLGGALYRGATGAGAELGHMVVDLDGPACFGDCPGRGCLEAVASGSALERDAAEAIRGRPDSRLAGEADAAGRVAGEAVSRLAAGGDPVAEGLVRDLGRRLGAGLAGLTMIFNPEVIVVGGGVGEAGELLLAPAREELRRRAMSPSRDVVGVVGAALGEHAGSVGAGLMAIEEAR
jgi:glucokinase